MKKENTRRVVTFNTDEFWYSEYKKILIDKKTTPTADLNEHIQKTVEESMAIDDSLLNSFKLILIKNKTNYKSVVEQLIKNYIENNE